MGINFKRAKKLALFLCKKILKKVLTKNKRSFIIKTQKQINVRKI